MGSERWLGYPISSPLSRAVPTGALSIMLSGHELFSSRRQNQLQSLPYPSFKCGHCNPFFAAKVLIPHLLIRSAKVKYNSEPLG